MSLITGTEMTMLPASKTLRRGAVVAVSLFGSLFVLVACGSDDGAALGSTTSVADAAAEASTNDDDHADDDGDHDDDDEHADDDGDHDGDDEHGDDEHGDDDHDEEGESSGGLGAHEHGAAELSVGWSEGEVVVDLISPTHNIFGFEYEPSTDEERALVADRTDALSEPGVIALNEEAGCELADEVVTELEFEGSHAELTASWLFNCENPDEIRQLDVSTLFDEFPNFVDIDAQWASPTGQSAAELTPSSTVLSLE